MWPPRSGSPSCWSAFLGALAAAAGPHLRRDAFAVPLALLCAACSLIVSAIGVRWDQSYRVQLATIAAFERDVGKPAPGQTVLLTGVCPSLGPAPVFDLLWDWPGALSLKTGQPLMKGDVVLPWERFEPDAVVTDQFGLKSRYPYGPGLILYDAALEARGGLDRPSGGRPPTWPQRPLHLPGHQ